MCFVPMKVFQARASSLWRQPLGHPITTVLCFIPPRPHDWMRWEIPSFSLAATTSWQNPFTFSASIRCFIVWKRDRTSTLNCFILNLLTCYSVSMLYSLPLSKVHKMVSPIEKTKKLKLSQWNFMILCLFHFLSAYYIYRWLSTRSSSAFFFFLCNVPKKSQIKYSIFSLNWPGWVWPWSPSFLSDSYC